LVIGIYLLICPFFTKASKGASIIGIIYIALFWQLRKFKLWAWKLNFVILILDAIFLTFVAHELITGTITALTNKLIFGTIRDIGWLCVTALFSISWIILNWIYFKKRRSLFS